MSRLRYQRPRLPSYFYVLSEPPDSRGEEVLRFVSERRRIKLKGHSFREFQRVRHTAAGRPPFTSRDRRESGGCVPSRGPGSRPATAGRP